MKRITKILLGVLGLLLIAMPSFAWDTGGWDSWRIFLSKDNTWTGSNTFNGDVTLGDAGIITMYDDGDDTNVVLGPVADGTTTLGITGGLNVSGNVAGATYGSDASISDAELLTLDNGATTEILVGGGAGSAPVWTTATGTGAPVRAGTPTLTTPEIGAATGTSLDASGTVSANLLTPDAADSADIGTAALEFSDVYLGAAAVINAELDQSNTLTSATTGWTANLMFITNGTLHGGIEIIADDNSLSAAQCRGSINKLNGAETTTLPAATAGMNVLLYSDDATVKTIDPNGTDHIWLNGVDNGAGNSIDSPGAVGNYIVLVAFSANNWYSLGRSGVWIDTP